MTKPTNVFLLSVFFAILNFPPTKDITRGIPNNFIFVFSDK
jgi:hypothetical protein